jgi:transposase-like protein
MSLTDTNGAGSHGAERAGGERGGVAAGRAAAAGAPDPELVERPKRRRYSAEYKLRVLREAEACARPGEVGALLRRGGLYTSHLTYWRKQRDQGALSAATSSSASCADASSARRRSSRRRAR